MDFEKEKREIWAECEKECGFPLFQKFRDYVEREEVGNPKEYIDGDPEGEDAYLESLQNVAKRYVAAMGLALKGKPSNGNNDKPSKPKRRYRKCFERRFYLVDFVVDRGCNTKTNRIDWKRTVMEWNKAHPSDTMSLPVLKAEYYRAMREGPLVLQYVVTSAVRMAEGYRQVFQDDNYVLEAKKLKEDYFEFYEWVMRILAFYLEVGPSSKFLSKSMGRLMETLKSTYEITKSEIDSWNEKQLKEAHHERLHSQEGQE